MQGEKLKIMAEQANTAQAYDKNPYVSYPYSQTDPALLRSIGHLFGLNAPPHETAKILEIGCADAGNIISIASLYPETECAGLDISPVQINLGLQKIKDYNLKNLSLKVMSVMDIDPNFGRFDYIICHGVFSWVPQEVQKQILSVCKNNLNPEGIAYISYNTMPGWGAIKSLREMMLYHTKRFENPQDKIAQARLLLKFIRDSNISPVTASTTDSAKNYYIELLESELNEISKSDSYLLHDHLEGNNTPYYFHQFMEMAETAELQYLSETAVSRMYTGNLSKQTADILSSTNDLIRTEQYLDFIYNRRFRSTLLCHNNRILRRNLNASDIADKYFSSKFILPEKFQDYNLNGNETLAFSTSSEITFSTNDKLFIVAIMILAAQQGKPMHIRKLAKEIIRKIKDSGLKLAASEEQVILSLSESLLKAIFADGIQLHFNEGAFTKEVSKTPKAFTLARNQALAQEWVSNMRMEMINIDAVEKALLPLLDGETNIKKLTQKSFDKFVSKELRMWQNNKEILDIKTIEKQLPEYLQSLLEKLAILALLES